MRESARFDLPARDLRDVRIVEVRYPRVRDCDHLEAVRHRRFELAAHESACCGVEALPRLVEQQQARPIDESPREKHSMHLAV
jgi:hypothetical protein